MFHDAHKTEFIPEGFAIFGLGYTMSISIFIFALIPIKLWGQELEIVGVTLPNVYTTKMSF